MARSVILLLALAGCASPETVIEVTRDPATGVITGSLSRSWLGGECYVTGSYRAPDGTVVEFAWASDVDLSAALQDREKSREAVKAALEAAIQAAGGR